MAFDEDTLSRRFADDFPALREHHRPTFVFLNSRELFDDIKQGKMQKFVPSFLSPANIQLSKTMSKYIFVRDSYLPLVEQIIQNINNGEITKLLVTGTPRIGKSSSLPIIGAQVARHCESIDTIVIVSQMSQPSSDPKKMEKTITGHMCSVIYLNKGAIKRGATSGLAGCFNIFSFRENEIGDLFETIPKANVLLLFDGFGAAPRGVRVAHNVISCASPGLTIYPAQENPFTTIWYLPVWTKMEMLKFSEEERVSRLTPRMKSEEDIDEICKYFGGVIGYYMQCFSDINLAKKGFYEFWIERQCFKNKDASVDATSTCQAILNLKPVENYPNECTKDWLCPEIEKAMEWLRARDYTMELYRRVQVTHGGEQGCAFEDAIGMSFYLFGKCLDLSFYPRYKSVLGDTEIWYAVNQQLILNFSQDKELVQFSNREAFGIRMNILYRLTNCAPAVDYYYICHVDPNDNLQQLSRHQGQELRRSNRDTKSGQQSSKPKKAKKAKKESGEQSSRPKYRLMLLQTTTGKRHTLVDDHVRQYLQNITENVKAKVNGNLLGADELPVPLSSEDVEIWHVYLQPTLKHDFQGDDVGRRNGLMTKVNIGYAFLNKPKRK